MEEISQFEFVALCQMADNQNKTFYVKYLNNNPVEVYTHFPPPAYYGPTPLSTVSQLIAAYKAAVSPDLDSVSMQKLTLHTSETDETALKPGQTLASLENGKTDDDPLIIKYNSGAGSNINGSFYGCGPTSSSLEAMECGADGTRRRDDKD